MPPHFQVSFVSCFLAVVGLLHWIFGRLEIIAAFPALVQRGALGGVPMDVEVAWLKAVVGWVV
jgi:hypothetical protein